MSIKNNTASLQQLLEVVNNLPDVGSGGIELPELTNPANTDEIFLNKEVIDENGKVKTGTFTIDNEINTQEDLLSELRAALNGKAGGGEQVAPEISVNASGLITATAGTKSSTYQMAFQPAKTITPSTASQVAVSSGYYTGGNITVAAIPSSYVVPSGTLNITENGAYDVKNYASATVEVSGGSNEATTDNIFKKITEGTVLSIYDNNITKLRPYAFAGITNLKTVELPKCSSMTEYTVYTTGMALEKKGFCFYACSQLSNVSLPKLTTIECNTFEYCTTLKTIYVPKCTEIGAYAFSNCLQLTSVNFPVCTSIHTYAFYRAYRLSSLTLGASTVCALSNSNVFYSTPFAGYSSYFSGTPHIYVPASLVSAYQSATNWTYFSSYFTGIPSDY